jgi:hypothetical protein
VVAASQNVFKYRAMADHVTVLQEQAAHTAKNAMQLPVVQLISA